ncbi:Hypothetical protein CINCED_3A006534 [Cinara cedri]|uniref:Uncharacterized protein n=1 Tax=Cinara cedri TaxID=506608 RepID=A0A5E4M441_9HEMI|nr:Hypothetical protein CINCED_3A006534 [Cinara cedri]
MSRHQSDDHQTQRVLRYLKGTENLCLVYPVKKMCDTVGGRCHADFASDTELRKSTTGYISQLFGSTIAWSSCKQLTVAMSSTRAYNVGQHSK